MFHHRLRRQRLRHRSPTPSRCHRETSRGAAQQSSRRRCQHRRARRQLRLRRPVEAAGPLAAHPVAARRWARTRRWASPLAMSEPSMLACLFVCFLCIRKVCFCLPEFGTHASMPSNCWVTGNHSQQLRCLWCSVWDGTGEPEATSQLPAAETDENRPPTPAQATAAADASAKQPDGQLGGESPTPAAPDGSGPPQDVLSQPADDASVAAAAAGDVATPQLAEPSQPPEAAASQEPAHAATVPDAPEPAQDAPSQPADAGPAAAAVDGAAAAEQAEPYQPMQPAETQQPMHAGSALPAGTLEADTEAAEAPSAAPMGTPVQPPARPSDSDVTVADELEAPGAAVLQLH